jgi:hypothetical protein
MAIHSFHRFIHKWCLGMHRINTDFTGRTGRQLWITAGWYWCAINSPIRYVSEMACLSKRPQMRPPCREPTPDSTLVCLLDGRREPAIRSAIMQGVSQADCKGL